MNGDIKSDPPTGIRSSSGGADFSSPRSPRRSVGLLLILVAGLLAFAGCLRADFYMDDFGFVLNFNGDAPASRRLHWLPGNPIVTGKEGVDTFNVKIFQLVPTGIHLLTEKLVPDVVEASWLYHLWNLLLHLVTACLTWYAGRQVLELAGLLKDNEARSRAALAGAVLFACHPLCSEPVHYAKCLNSITVALFGMMMTGGTADWLQTRSRRALTIACVGFAGATLSYFPGLALAVIWGVLLFVFWWRTASRRDPAGERRAIRGKPQMFSGVCVSVVIFGIAAWRFYPVLAEQIEKWGPEYPKHFFTQGRVFWDYLARAAIPVGLSSDHYVPWSRPWLDVEATAKLILACAVGVTSLVLVCSRRAVRLRGWALLVMLGTVPLFMRFGYVNAEHFVEYRAYPAVPWLMLLLTTVLFHVAGRFPRGARVPLAGSMVLAMVWIILSIQRSKVWTSQESLWVDALVKSPLNPRPLTQLQAIANDRGETDAVIQLNQQVRSLVSKLEAFERRHPDRYFDRARLGDALIHSSQWMVYAVADKSGSAVALKYAEEAIAEMRAMMPGKFVLSEGSTVYDAWPLLMARDTVRDNAAQIDAARADRATQPKP